MLIKASKKGFSLVELMVALSLSSLVLVSVVALFSDNVRHSKDNFNANRLHQEMQAAVEVMVKDIRRAGYWGNAITDIDTGANTNPFMASATDITINGNNDCILFSYDRDDNGALPTLGSGNDDERYGYRLSNGVIQSRPSGSPFSCTTANTNWEDIIGSKIIQITGLTFTPTIKSIDLDGAESGTANTLIRTIDITLSGQLKNDSSVNHTITHRVRVRNDKFAP